MLVLNDTGVAGSTTANFANTVKRVGNNFELYGANGATLMISSEGGGTALNFTSTFQNVHTAGNNHNFRIGTGAPVSALYIDSNRNISVGSTSSGARLDIRAQGALSTDIAFRVRNSVDNANLFEFSGDGTFRIGGTTSTQNGFSYITDGRLFMAKSGANFIELNPTAANRLYSTNGWEFEAVGAGKYLTFGVNGAVRMRMIDGTIQIGSFNTSDNATNTMYFLNGTAPNTNHPDIFKLYSADIVAGNAAPHFRTEAGNIVKLYTQAAVTSSQGIADALTNLGFLTGSSTIVSSTPFPFTGSARITGSLGVTGSASIFAFTGSTATIFNVRNSANTLDIIKANGRGDAFIGQGAGRLTTGVSNTFMGINAGSNNITGQENTAIGASAGGSNLGSFNTYIGTGAGQNGTTSEGSTFIGYYAGQNSNANYAVLIGYTAGTTAGNGSVAIGYNAGPGTGTHNLSIGQSAGAGMTTGAINMHLGYRTVGSGVTTGNYNTLVGGDIVVGNVSNNAVLADMQGNIAVRKDANHYVGIGYTGSATLGAKLDVKAQGALSTDLAFRVRNSADTKNILKIQGDGNAYLGEDTDSGQKSFYVNTYNNPRFVMDTGYSTDTGVVSITRRYYGTIGVYNDNVMLLSHNSFSDGNNYTYKMHFVNPSSYYGSVLDSNGYNAGFMWHKDSATIANLQMKLSPDNALSIYTSSASPLESVITGSGFQIWASGSAGNAKPYIRTQNGTVVWLGDESRLFNVTASRTIISSSQSTASGSSLTVYGSGSTQPVFTVQGSQGELFSVTDSLSGSLFSVNDISGLPILEVFSDNTTLIGNYQDPMLITTAKIVQTNSGSFTLYSLPTASYDTAFFEYSVKSGSNARAGTIMAIQSGTSVNFTETTTTSFGSTSAISFIVIVTGSNMALTGSSTSGAWTIKTIVRGL